jgi:uncharacterized membrane protein
MNFLLFTLLSFGTATAADPNSPHPHKGVAERFTNPKPTTLNATEKAQLLRGEAVRRQIRSDSGGRGIAIMDIAAPPEKIWEVIVDYKGYPNWIDDLESTKIYGGDKATGYKVQFELSVFGIGVTYYIDHDFSPAQGAMTWQLDYSRESDIDDSTGYWLVYPATDHPGHTRLEYSVDLRLKGWIPGIVENMLAKKGLTLATSWVKKQSE